MKPTPLFIALLFSLAVISNTEAVPGPASNDAAQQSRGISMKLNEEGAALAQNGKTDQAEQLLRRAVEADPGNLAAVYNLASLYMNNKKEKLGITLLEQYVGEGAEDPGLFARLGDGYFATRQIDKAVKMYNRAYQLDPKFPGIAEKLGTLYSLQERLDEAEKMLLIAAEQTPRNGQLIANLSNVFLANGKPSKAVSTAKRGLQIKATSDLYRTLGSAYEALEDYKNSLIAFQRAADLGDKTSELSEKIDQIEKLAS